MKPIVVTSGEPAGVGPELTAKLTLVPESPPVPVVILGDSHLLQDRAKGVSLKPNWQLIERWEQANEPGYFVLHEPLTAPCTIGKPTSENGQYVLNLLNQATDFCRQGMASAMVTAPIQKSSISPIYKGFQGHTEYLADRCQVNRVVMMLQGGGLRVALATTHIPLHKVPAALSRESLTETLDILVHDLKTHFGIPEPRVLVTGLNPHAGESGTMGREEIEVIQPVLDEFRRKGFNIIGPLPADTLFQPKYLDQADAVLAMYHDQGLPVLKYASFGKGINITLGLPIIRTSVDHGTALDLAGTGKADVGSLHEALKLAIELGSTP